MPDGPVAEIVIPRHAVPCGPDGLSPLQVRMLDDPAPVRIFSAPTGAGKSYAFQVAMRERRARILFIVPTRRLAQNLAAGLRRDLIASGYSEAVAAERVCLWTSDERLRQQAEDPSRNATRRRIREIRTEADIPSGGVMIIATPESVAWYLLQPRRVEGGADAQGIHDLLRLDHVVFDEFHTIEARGMGLSMALATFLAQDVAQTKLTFLSATPIDIATSLASFGIPLERITSAAETVVTGAALQTPGMRAIHGDVRLVLRRDRDMLAALKAHRTDIVATLALDPGMPGSQVVIIFDSVRDLQNSKTALAAYLDAIGAGRAERLAINSIDDSIDFDESGLFVAGREADPLRYRVLVATASVEMGVTFNAGLIVMNPGHDACSFVQRIGRAARGDVEGRVIVTASETMEKRHGWYRRVLGDLAAGTPELPVEAFVGTVLRTTRERFEVREEELARDDGMFRRMPQSAAWCAAVFWAALEEASPFKGMTETLRAFRPAKAGSVRKWLEDLRKSGLESAAAWRKAFLLEARRLRMIVPPVILVDPEGKTRKIPWHLYASDRSLSRLPARETAQGDLEVFVSSPVDLVVRELERSQPVRRREEVLLPHVSRSVLLDLDGLALAFGRRLDAEAKSPRLRAAQRDVIEAAQRLVALSRIVPTLEGAKEAADGCAII